MDKPLKPQPDFLKKLTNTKNPFLALAELIWNGFDADANTVEIILTENLITVRDDGFGIAYKELENKFGNLGYANNKSVKPQKGKYRNGKEGTGRLKAFSLGKDIEWDTRYESDDGKLYSYTITAHRDDLTKYTLSEPILSTHETTGTSVRINNLLTKPATFSDETLVKQNLAIFFAPHLRANTDLTIKVNARELETQSLIEQSKHYALEKIELSNGKVIFPNIEIVEWNTNISRTLCFCDENGIVLHEQKLHRRLSQFKNFWFTIYIKDAAFKELYQTGVFTEHEEIDDRDIKNIISDTMEKTKMHFRERLAEQSAHFVERWKAEKIYPYSDTSTSSIINKKEQEVFDIVAAKVNTYLPDFDKQDVNAKKFTFALIAQAIQQDSVHLEKIITEVLKLDDKEQEDFAKLLGQTSLSSIIKASRTVTNRLDFLKGLEEIVFNPESKKSCLERDQLHKILEKEAWIFDENFTLAGSEVSLDTVLNKHLAILRPEQGKDADSTLENGNGKCRFDLFFHKQIKPHEDEIEYLVVELKRPSRKIDAEVIFQISNYAQKVSSEPSFNSGKVFWTFIAVANEIDSSVRARLSQLGRPKGLFEEYEDKCRVSVWCKTWAEIINTARAKLEFIDKQLNYEVTQLSMLEYLHTTHEKYLPHTSNLNNDQKPH